MTRHTEGILTLTELKSLRRRDPELFERFTALAARLDLEPDLCARYLLKAAVEALEDEETFVWPLYLTQAGTQAGEFTHTRFGRS
jgi:hypothetical protein